MKFVISPFVNLMDTEFQFKGKNLMNFIVPLLVLLKESLKYIDLILSFSISLELLRFVFSLRSNPNDGYLLNVAILSQLILIGLKFIRFLETLRILLQGNMFVILKMFCT